MICANSQHSISRLATNYPSFTEDMLAALYGLGSILGSHPKPNPKPSSKKALNLSLTLNLATAQNLSSKFKLHLIPMFISTGIWVALKVFLRV